MIIIAVLCCTVQRGISPRYNEKDIDDRIIFTQDGIYKNGELITEEKINEIKSKNFPTVEELKHKYPDKKIITWLLSSINTIDYIANFRTDEINEYLDSIGCNFAVCFIPMEDHSASYAEALNSMQNNDIQIDIVSPSYRLEDEGYENNYQRDARLGILEPLDEYFNNSDLGKEFYNAMPEEYLDSFRVDGKIYGISNTANNFICSVGYSVDKSLSIQYGWDVNKSVIEQIQLLSKYSLEHKNGCTVYCENYGTVLYYPHRFDRWLGVYWDYTTDSISKITSCEEYIEGLNDLYTLQQNDLLTYNLPIKSESCFIFMGGLEYYGEDSSSFYQNIGNSNSKRIPVHSELSIIGNILNAIGISSISENKEEAFELIMLTQCDKYLNNLLVFGVENEDYKLVNGRAEHSINDILNFYRFGNLSLCYPFDSFSQSINSDYGQARSMTAVAPYAGFAFCVDPVINEYIQIKNVVLNHDFMGYSNAGESINALDKALCNAGIDRVIEEMNRQFKDWKENEK